MCLYYLLSSEVEKGLILEVDYSYLENGFLEIVLPPSEVEHL